MVLADVKDDPRVPPQDLNAERSVLGGMLLAKDAIRDVLEVIKGEDFYWPKHEIIYNAIVELEALGQPADAITVSDELVKRQELDKVGGSAYLHELAQYVPTASNADYYAQIVRDKAMLRAIIGVGTKITTMGYKQEGEIDDIIDIAQQEIYAIAKAGEKDDYTLLGDVISEVAQEIDEISKNNSVLTGISTGFIDVDRFTHGLHGGQMVVIAARPGIGKSTLALDFAREAAIKNNIPTAFFSLEMGRNEIVMKVLAAQGSIMYGKLRSGRLTERDWTTLSGLEGKLRDAPLLIDDSPNLTLAEIRAKARRLKEQYNLGLLIIDYLQLMTSGKKMESRQQEVSEFSRSLKLLAKELDIPVVALSQLNRSSEQRGDKRPQISDLRESGAIEQDADIVFLIHREFINDPEHPDAHKAEILVAKNRGGPTGSVDMIFQGKFSRMRTATSQVIPENGSDDSTNRNGNGGFGNPQVQDSDSVAAQSW